MPCPMYVNFVKLLHYTDNVQRLDARNVISTALSTSVSSIDYAARLAKILARRMQSPVYVGCSMNFAGVAADEEMEGLTLAVHEIMQEWTRRS